MKSKPYKFAVALLFIALTGCGTLDADEDRTASPDTSTHTGVYMWGEQSLEVEFVERDGLYLFQGDIILDPEQLTFTEDGAHRAALAAKPPKSRWPGGVIPYEIAPDLPNKARVEAAIEHYHQKTSLRFVPRNGAAAYVRIEPGSGCYAYVGHTGGAQKVVLAEGCDKHAVIHELGHTAGLWHTHSRNDRDQHIKIHFENIIPGKEGNFRSFEQQSVDGSSVGPYETDSVMHYSPHAFSNNGKPTITRKDGSVYSQSRGGLTTNDARSLKTYYASEVAKRAVVTLPGDFGAGAVLAQFREDGTWWVGRAQGADVVFEPWATFSTATGWTDHLVGDFNGDQRDDVASYHPGSGRWWVGLSDGTKFRHTRWAEYATKTGWGPNLVGDFNGDGKDDIASYHEGAGRWWVSRSTGSKFNLSMFAQFGTKSGWDPQIAGDFDGDGIDDIASYHAGAGRWWVSRSSGSSFTPELWAQFSTRTGWSQQQAGDLDGDGRTDVVNYHVDSGRWWIGTSAISAFDVGLWGEFASRTGWSRHEVADFDGDGTDDIAHYHPGRGRWWLTLSGPGGFSLAKWADYGGATAFADQAVADFDGDGRADVAQTTDRISWRISYSTGNSFR